MSATRIEWTDVVWNPTTGCDRVSPGCDHCYALTMARRLKGMRNPKYQRDGDPRTSGLGFALTVHPDVVNLPIRWRKPRRILVNSMSDLFHAAVPDPWLADIFAVMAFARQHTFQVLTKRHARLRSLLNDEEWISQVFDRATDLGANVGKGMPRAQWIWPLPNVWLGVSAEDQKSAERRLDALVDTPAAVRWVSAEPLLNQLDIGPWLGSLSWVVAGGESGSQARPMNSRWARLLRDQCSAAGVPFLFRQWGEWAPAAWKGEGGATHAFTGGFYREAGLDVEGFMALGHSPTSLERDDRTPHGAQGMRRVGKKAAGRLLDGVLHDGYPEVRGA